MGSGQRQATSSAPDHRAQHFVDIADATVEWVAALENVCTAGCHRDEFG